MGSGQIKIYKYLCVAIFFLVCLGGGVRAMNAGLACPDWPLCFGDIIPDYHPQVYFEFLHRALAGLVGIVSVWLNILIIKNEKFSRGLKAAAFVSIILLLAQVVMGGLTVLLQLHEKIVALHLAMGTGFFALSLWIYASLRSLGGPINDDSKASVASGLLTFFVYGQIILGGLVASHYAALVCTEFPTCHGKFIPTLSGIIGLHVIHRLGAYFLTAVVLIYTVYILKNSFSSRLKRNAKLILTVLLFQVGVGIANVLLMTPPLITVVHLGLGTLLLGLSVYSLRLATIVEGTTKVPFAGDQPMKHQAVKTDWPFEHDLESNSAR